MNVLLIYPKLEKAYWSAPTTNRFQGAKALGIPLGLLTVAALLPHDWTPYLVDLNTREIQEADWEKADVVMLSAMLAQRTDLLRLIPEAKRRGKTVVVGGPYPSSLPDELTAVGADYVSCGEAETTLPLILQAMERGQKGIFQSDKRPDLTRSPIPHFELVRFEGYKYAVVQTSRGCPHACEFCDVIHFLGRNPRYKNPDQVIQELECLYKGRYRGLVFISDDNFIGNRSRAKEILLRIIQWQAERGDPFAFCTQASIELGADPELIDLMTSANVWLVFIGLESPDQDALEISQKHQNVRASVIDAIRTLNAGGLTVLGSFMIGMDGERRGVDKRICAFMEEAAIPVAMVSILRAPPGTALWKRLQREGRLHSTFIPSMDCVCTDLNFVPERPAKEIAQEYKRIYEYLYEPSRLLARTFRYYAGMRPTRSAVARKGDGWALQIYPVCSRTIRRRLYDLNGLFHLIWRQGIVRQTRIQFWKQLWQMVRLNPRRLPVYLHDCGFGEDMILIRQEILAQEQANSPLGILRG